LKLILEHRNHPKAREVLMLIVERVPELIPEIMPEMMLGEKIRKNA
jgi:hypothetical protein